MVSPQLTFHWTSLSLFSLIIDQYMESVKTTFKKHLVLFFKQLKAQQVVSLVKSCLDIYKPKVRT